MKYQHYKYLITFILGIVAFNPLVAQVYLSNNGLFEVNAREACTGFQIEIIDPCSNCDYIDNEGIQLPRSYDTPGTYEIVGYFPDEQSDTVEIIIHENIEPEFNLLKCGGGNVHLRVNDYNYDSYSINWGDDSANTTISGGVKTSLHVYSGTGSYNIQVQGLFAEGNGTGNCSPGTKDITIDGTLPTAAIKEIYPLNNQNNQVVIKYNAPPNALYRLQLAINNNENWINSQIILASKDNVSIDSIVVANLSLDQSFYCFRIATQDACTPGDPEQEYSAILCTQDLDINFASNKVNTLTWQTNSNGINGFTILKGSETIGPLSDATRRSYDDSAVECNQDYCYTLISHYNGASVRSLTKCGTAKHVYDPDPINNVIIQVDGQEINLSWIEPPTVEVNHYNLFVAVNGGNYSVAATNVAQATYTDLNRAPASNLYCYNINYEDECNNISENTPPICAIYLNGNISSRKVTLDWNAYMGYLNEVEYYILEKFDQDGNLLMSTQLTGISLVDSLEIEDPQKISYRIIAKPWDPALPVAISNIFVAERPTVLKAPNAFTPNSGDVNSSFKIISPFIEEVDMKIYNRWGEIVFHTNDPANPGWPGTDMSGKPLPQGTYIYFIIIKSESGRIVEKKGSVFLIKN